MANRSNPTSFTEHPASTNQHSTAGIDLEYRYPPIVSQGTGDWRAAGFRQTVVSQLHALPFESGTFSAAGVASQIVAEYLRRIGEAEVADALSDLIG